jgi:transcriptional regulator with XRE-family HTH domain
MRKNPVRRLERILARRIRELAAEREVPLSHLADRAGVSRSLLWEIFAQSASVTLETVQRLSDALELKDPLELLRGAPAAARGARKVAKRRQR